MKTITGTIIAVTAALFSASVAQASEGKGVWSANIDYVHTLDRPDLVANNARNYDTARPGFATLQRSFGKGEFQPYIGVGVGKAETLFETAAPRANDALAVKGVIGSNLKFTENVGGFIQYDYSVASNALSAVEKERKSHALQFGLRISLN